MAHVSVYHTFLASLPDTLERFPLTPRKSTRRDFLRGKTAGDAAADALSQNAPEGPSAGTPEKTYQLQITRRAMACPFEVRLNAGQYEQGTEVALEVLDLVDELEDQISIFRESSEICQINRTAARTAVEVEPRLFELLKLSMQLDEETGGAFDVTATPLWETWGFARREAAIPDEEELADAMRCVGGHLVQLDSKHRTVRFVEEGVRLNLGGIGKGFALDRCAQRMSEAGIDDYLLHGGHSSVAAHGCQAIAPQETPTDRASGWEVGIRHPLRPERRMAKIWLRHRALATSGSWAQSFVHQGHRYGHILDPRTGWPAEGVLSATAIAPTATLADALSTAFYVLGPDATEDYCQGRPEIAAVLACPIRHSGGLEIRTVGLDEGELVVL